MPDSRCLILNLHSISPKPSRYAPAMLPEVFDELLGWLRRHAQVATLAELHHGAHDRTRPAVALSFDDGYRDFLDYAVPVLDRHGLAANQNVIPGCVEAARPPFNIHLLDVIETLPPERLRDLPGPGADVMLARADPVRYGVVLSNWFKSKSRTDRELLEGELTAALPELRDGPIRPMLNASEVNQLAAAHEIGAHSFHHDSMAGETDDFFAQDLGRCSTWFDRVLGSPLSIYAFPNGSYRRSQVEIALASGVEHVLLVDQGPAAIAKPVRRRVTTFGGGAAEVRMRIARATR